MCPSDSSDLAALRHSCAHVMAQAVQELFPGTRIAIGPAIEDGFYYDFDGPHRFSEEDLAAIERRMGEIAKGDHPFSGRELGYEESHRYWEGRQEKYKLEILDDIRRRGEKITHYTHDSFTDLCRGGHVGRTGEIRHFKLLSVAGAYWRGDEKNAMLQRIYGTAWATKEDLDRHLSALKEAKRRDHRKLGAELGLFSIEEEAGPGLVFWHPKGARLRLLIEDWLRAEVLGRGYDVVYTPHIAKSELWKTSGHSQFFRSNMFGELDVEKIPYQLKPMNCPFHILIYKSVLRSYRDLPLRLSELGTVYRFERSGVLHGLLRVRGFTQDDAHIFCAPESVESEVDACLDFALAVFKTFGFERFEVELSTWDPAQASHYAGEAADWESNQGALERVLAARGIPCKVIPGEAAFYGPKIDFKVVDAIGRPWQLSTIQFDFNLPERFKLEYVAKDGSRKRPIMVHRALLGSVERFMAILIEHYAGRFPLWLAPVQARIATVSEGQEKEARALEGRLKAAGLRVESDIRPDTVGLKIREGALAKIPCLIIIGPKEAAAGTLSVRLGDGKQVSGVSEDDLLRKIRENVGAKAPAFGWGDGGPKK